jgi:hypothetical protein
MPVDENPAAGLVSRRLFWWRDVVRKSGTMRVYASWLCWAAGSGGQVNRRSRRARARAASRCRMSSLAACAGCQFVQGEAQRVALAGAATAAGSCWACRWFDQGEAREAQLEAGSPGANRRSVVTSVGRRSVVKVGLKPHAGSANSLERAVDEPPARVLAAIASLSASWSNQPRWLALIVQPRTRGSWLRSWTPR